MVLCSKIQVNRAHFVHGLKWYLFWPVFSMICLTVEGLVGSNVSSVSGGGWGMPRQYVAAIISIWGFIFSCLTHYFLPWQGGRFSGWNLPFHSHLASASSKSSLVPLGKSLENCLRGPHPYLKKPIVGVKMELVCRFLYRYLYWLDNGFKFALSGILPRHSWTSKREWVTIDCYW